MSWLFRRGGRAVLTSKKCSAKYKAGKVVLYGATSPVGQMLSLLLKLSPHVSEMVCCSTAMDELFVLQNNMRTLHRSASLLSNDLNSIDTDGVITTVPRNGQEQWKDILQDAQLALICAGPNFDLLRSDRDEALSCIAPVVQPFVETIASAAPHIVIGVVSEPVNALTALCAEWLKAKNAYDPRKLFGITSLDTIRARNLVGEALEMNPFDITLSVIGGRGAGVSLPLLTHSKLCLPLGSIECITQTLMCDYKGRPLKKIETDCNSVSSTFDDKVEEYEESFAREEHGRYYYEQVQQGEEVQREYSTNANNEHLECSESNIEESSSHVVEKCKLSSTLTNNTQIRENTKNEKANKSEESLSQENVLENFNVNDRNKEVTRNQNSSKDNNTNSNNYDSNSDSNKTSNNHSEEEEEIIPCPSNTCASDMAVSCACYEFIVSILKAMRGDMGICECALTELPLYDEVPFFAAKLLLGRDGVERVIVHDDLSTYEKTILHESVLPELLNDIQAGTAYHTKNTSL